MNNLENNLITTQIISSKLPLDAQTLHMFLFKQLYQIGQGCGDLHCGGFPSSVVTQERRNLTLVEVQTQFIDGSFASLLVNLQWKLTKIITMEIPQQLQFLTRFKS